MLSYSGLILPLILNFEPTATVLGWLEQFFILQIIVLYLEVELK